ncbi:hypothetical protein MiSe_52900 [Microseira wollei NIES-4236]|uniref:Inactive STAND domain-containing protein n=1 Tax=Microseira wollei NIES-4236 TaxID=2530354 RepID=A0AAV3XIC9_9CYAN|nr:hypothetical protein MiSe_52900 [Microseira wollei NIES-4236]
MREFRLDVTTAKKIFRSLPDNREVYIDDLWSRFRDSLQLSRTASVGEIVNYLYNCWQDGTVILIFDNLDQLYETEPKKMLQEFWQNLVAMLSDRSNYCDSYFLMFLVDNCNFSEKWEIDLVTL